MPPMVAQALAPVLTYQRERMAEQDVIITTPAMLLEAHGREYHVTPESFGGYRGPPGHCYDNAAWVALLSYGRLQYVEGWMVWLGVPLEHAWCADAEGNVVDPTITPKLVAEAKGELPLYFGIPFCHQYVILVKERTDAWGIMGPHNLPLFAGLDEGFLAEEA